MDIKHYTYWPKQPKNPDSLVILLHGLGADGQDLISLAPYFAKALPNTAFVAPDAPFPCDMAPMGYQWFSLQDRTPSVMLDGATQAAPIIDAFIDSQKDAYGLDDNKIALLGFSQGTMMSLYVAPRREKPLAAVLGYSGALLGSDVLKDESKSHPPIRLIHGNMDDIVPYEALAKAASILAKAGFETETVTCEGTGHSIDEKGLVSGIEFLQKNLKTA